MIGSAVRHVAALAGAAGLNRLARTRLRRRLLVLCYHGVCGERLNVPDSGGIQLPLPLFEVQLDRLLRQYRPVSLAQVRDAWMNRAALPERPVLLTFDDGYRNTVMNALPALRRRGVPAALFVVAGLVENRGALWTSLVECAYGDTAEMRRQKLRLKRMPAAQRRAWLAANLPPDPLPPDSDYALATWLELAAALAASGDALAIGSHGFTHELLATCEPPEVEHELRESARLIAERLGATPHSVAYPGGSCNEAVLRASGAAGYELGFTTAPRHAAPADAPLALPRLLVGRRDTPALFEARLAGWMQPLGLP